jgi:COMPASS component SWD3
MSVKTIPELQCIHTFSMQGKHNEHVNVINAVAISPDNTRIASAGDKLQNNAHQPSFMTWDLTTGKSRGVGKAISSETHQSNLSWLSFSADSKFIALSSTDQTSQYHNYPSLSFWAVESIPEHSVQKPEHGGITVIASHPKELQFATINQRGIIHLWHDYNQTGVLHELKSWQGHASVSYAMIFSADGSLICSGSCENNIKLWDSVSSNLVREFPKQDKNIRSLALSSDNKILVSGSNQRIKIWDAETGELRQSFFGHPDWVRGLAITPDNNFLISAGDSRIKIWDLETGEKLKTIPGHAAAIRGMALSQDGQLLVTGSREGVVKIWNVKS